jgi:hypothetical protein
MQWNRAMDTNKLRRLRICVLKRQLEKCRRESAALCRDFLAAFTMEQKAAIAHFWERAIKEGRAIQFTLDHLGEQDMQEAAKSEGESPAARDMISATQI